MVLYFYPKDDTPGCTKEACAFRDRTRELAAKGAVVLGVSPDDVASHGKFRDKYSLNFPLLADDGHQVAERYGAWREKNMYGKTSMGIQRSTFLIDADGKVRKVWKKVNVDGHDEAVLEALATECCSAPALGSGAARRPPRPSPHPRHRVNYARFPGSSPWTA